MDNNEKPTSDRREFLGSIATGAAALGMATLGVAIPADVSAEALAKEEANEVPQQEVESWFDKIKGKHKMVFDVTKPHEIFPFAWPRVFLNSNIATGTPEKECGIVVVLRHNAIGYAFEDRLWEKYKFGDMFGANDPATKASALRNPFSNPKEGEYKVPGVGVIAIGIKELQASGVLCCVCNTAMIKTAAVLGAGMNMDPTEIRKDLMAGLIPGIQVVPSGVWAIGRAQERGCGYIFAS
jgi:intracellular sulfur oxidation DsrE/DsrF family protein